MTVLWWILVMFVIAVWAVTLLDIFRRWSDRSVGTSVAWLIAILIFPVLGTIVYFIVNDVRGARRGTA
jgi:uncharacterized membrane protein YqhA